MPVLGIRHQCGLADDTHVAVKLIAHAVTVFPRADRPNEKGEAFAPPFHVHAVFTTCLQLRRRRFLRNHAHLVVEDLHEAAADVEAAATAGTEAQLAIAE